MLGIGFNPISIAARGQGVGAPAGSLLLRGFSSASASLQLYGYNSAGNSVRLLGKVAS